MKKIAVLGCGLVGSVLARDLASDPELEVTVYDRSREALDSLAAAARVKTSPADLGSRAEIEKAARAADVVVGAVPGFLGRAMLETVIDAGRSIADISFAPEDPLDLDSRAREKGVTAVIDCGVSPGLSNFAVGRAAAEMDEVEDVTIYVGGLPAVRRWPYEYGIVFSATDVIEEYTRPARVVENGRIVVKPALSETERLDFDGVGTLEAFLTDGLRTLLSTVPAHNIREKTMRYPGHAEIMRVLRETGFFDEAPIEISGAKVSPRALTEKLLFRAWKLRPQDEEVTVLRVVVAGMKGGRPLRKTFDLLDRTDPAGPTTSMARTTAFPCAIVARLLASGEYRDPGVRGLEHLARDAKLADRLTGELHRRGVGWKQG